MTDTPAHTPLPLSCTHNSWERSTIYDANGYEICAIEISWEADEDTQDHFEALKEANAAFIVRACNSHYQLVEAAKAIMPTNLNLADWLPDDATIPLDVPVSELRALAAALSQAGGASE